MIPVLRFYLAVQVLAAAVLPLALVVMGRLPDRGYFFAKTLGILMHGVVLWVGVGCGLLRNDAGGALLAVALTAALAVAWGGRFRTPGADHVSPWKWVSTQAPVVMAAEALFLVAFVGWAFVRAHEPAADHTERPMDLLFLTGIHESPSLPPRDPWLAGHAISYYYLGYWLVNSVALLAGQPPAVAYNVGQACWLGLLLSGACGIGYGLLRLAGAGRRSALVAGLFSAFAVGLVGNVQGVLDVLQRQGLDLTMLARGRATHNFSTPSEHWWWWRAARVLQDRDAAGGAVEVIDEFPAFTYLVGDGHPHLLAMPFLLLTVAVAVNIALAGPGAGPGVLRVFPLGARGLAVTALAVGALVPLNTWDYPAAGLLVVLAALAAAHDQSFPRRAVTALVLTLGGALTIGPALVFLPYLLSAQSQAEGLRANLLHPTPLFQFLLMFGPLLAGVVVLLALGYGPGGERLRRVLRHAGAGAALVTLPWAGVLIFASADAGASLQAWVAAPWTLFWMSALLGLVVGETSRADPANDPSRRLGLALAGLGLLLILIAELVYVQDGFGTRMNTVFKLYNQAWLFLALATAYAVSMAWRAGGKLRLASGAVALMVGSGLLYTTAAVYSIAGGFQSPPSTLNALAYLETAAPDERAAIDWIRRHTRPEDIVLQGKASSYQPAQARVSVATGRPTLLGWEGHELQWRGRDYGTMAAGRLEAMSAIYAGTDAARMAAALAEWNVAYVFVGPAERQHYGTDPVAEGLRGQAMDLVFEQGEVRVYRRHGPHPGMGR